MALSTREEAKANKTVPLGQASKKLWLLLYNLLSAIGWLIILCRVVSIAPIWGNAELMSSTITFVRYVQTGAVLEILHSLFGLVRSPVLTTVMQVSSRLLLVHIVYPSFPALVSADSSWPNATMLLAWSFTEVVRYTYFFALLGGFDDFSFAVDNILPVIKWFRYNGFWVLYPIGISSECWLIWQGLRLERARTMGGLMARLLKQGGDWTPLAVVLAVSLAAYLPGAPILYSHMVKQRAKVLKKDRGTPKVSEKKIQ